MQVPADFDRAAIASPLASPRCPRVHQRLSRWLTIGEWKARGVIVAGYPAPEDGEQARLIEPDGPGLTAYLVTTNYDAVLGLQLLEFLRAVGRAAGGRHRAVARALGARPAWLYQPCR